MAYTTRQPNVPAGVRSRVYRRIVDQLQNDPALSAAVKTWDTGLDATAVRTNAASQVAVALTPRIGPTERASVESWSGFLEIVVEVAPAGGAVGLPDAGYMLDLAELFENAIYPRPVTDSEADQIAARDKRLAFQRELGEAGAEPAEIHFVSPPTAHATKDGVACLGMMRVKIRRALNV